MTEVELIGKRKEIRKTVEKIRKAEDDLLKSRDRIFI